MNKTIETPKSVTPRMQTTEFRIVGTSPLIMTRFSHTCGCAKIEDKNVTLEELYEASQFISTDGWCGINAGAFRLAMIGACRLVNFKMTLAKLSVFVLVDGHDSRDGTPLVRILGDDPIMDVRPVRDAKNAFVMRPRPMWKDWSCVLKVKFDQDAFSRTDITNILTRAGGLWGVGEGRASGKNWGSFEVQS